MAKNRTAMDLFLSFRTELLALLLLTLAVGLTVSQYMMNVREQMRRVEPRARKRSIRRAA